MNKTKNDITITKFLTAFFKNENETINLITLAPKGTSGRPAYYKTTCGTFSENTHLQQQLIRDNETKGVYFFVNSGGVKDADITKYNAFFIENDELSIEKQHELLDNAPIQPNIRVVTKRSVHAYWVIDGSCSQSVWREVQSMLIAFFDSDKSIKNPMRCMRLPFFNHVSYDGSDYNLKKVEVATFDPSGRFTVDQMKQAFSSPKVVIEDKSNIESAVEQSSSSLNSLNSYESTEYKDYAPAAEFKTGEKLSSLNSLNSLQSDKNVQDEFVSAAASTIPALPLERKCFYGLAGEIVKTIEPYTEADSMALLLNVLVAFGNAIGRKAFSEADGSKHYTNLFGVLVGSTSAGKGTSWSQIKRLFESVDNEWARKQIQSGLSSGEGLICAVKDDEESKEDNEPPKDKRLLVVESEFSSVLSVTKREGNTLSANIRGFWDDGTAQIMTKNNPIAVHDAHVSIIGHITPDELRHCIGKTEIVNGFANRFLWLQVKRSKSLPEGGKVPADELNALTEKLSEVIEFARTVEEVERDQEARLLWCNEYAKLTAERSGAFGSVTSRSRPQVVRLSMIYALMDRSNVVRREHMEAALNLWNYCENSAGQIFGQSTGDKLADEIYRHLKASEKGLSKTDIYKVTHKNYSAKQIEDAILILVANGLAYSHDEKREGSTKYVEVWYWYEFNELIGSSTKGIAQNDLGVAE